MSLKTDVNGIKDEIMAYYDQEHTHYGNDATFIDWDSKQTFLEDCAKIAHFLANGETQVVPMLNAIEAEIGLRVDSNLGQAISYWERKQARYTSLINAKYEQSVLGQLPYPDAKSQWQKNSNDEWKRTSSPVAKEGLFGGVVPGILKQGLMTGTAFDGDFPVFVSFINTTDFNKNLVSKHHWKDPGVNPSHGEFTHQIQWWAIVMAKDTIGLTGKVSEVFEEIGKV